MTKRIFAMLMSLILVMALLASCAGGGASTETTAGDGAGTTSGADTTGVTVVTTTGGTAPADPEAKPIKAYMDNYQIIYAADADTELIEDITRLSGEVETEFGIDLSPMADTAVEADPNALEILIGETNRPLSNTALLELRIDDYMLRYDPESGCIVILGGSTETTQEALDVFGEELLSHARADMTFAPDNNYTTFDLADYPLLSYSIDGVDIRNYTIVVPNEADLLTYYAGQNIADYFAVQMGVKLPFVTDATAETRYEILVGETNRRDSNIQVDLGEGQYVLCLQGDKLVLQGETYMVGGGFGMLVKETVDLSLNNQAVEISNLSTIPVARDYVFTDTYTNAILMIGDGMGFNHVGMALRNGLSDFVAETLPYQGSAITQSQSVINGQAKMTDSAASATALATGYKTLNGMVGQAPDGTNVQNVRELAQLFGAQTAVVTTDAITGATPSGFLAHVASRNSTTEIQSQIDALINNKKIDYCAGSVGDGLLNNTRAALMEISDSTDPFFIMVEEAYIDKNSHNADMQNTYLTVVRYNQSIAYAIGFTLCHPGTALIITADHETGGILPASSLADLNGKMDATSITAHQSKLQSDIDTYGYVYTSYYNNSGNGCDHTNKNVPVYALGPGTQIFDAVATDNTDIARFIAVAFGSTDFGQ